MRGAELIGMSKGRLEAFSDGVFAIIITIMVLELKAPHEPNLESLKLLIPVFLSYILSFIYVGIYWNNHHHLFQAVRHIKGGTLTGAVHYKLGRGYQLRCLACFNLWCCALHGRVRLLDTCTGAVAL